MSAGSVRSRSAGSIGTMSAKSIKVAPAPGPDLPQWARKPSVYAQPDDMDDEIGTNGSIAGLFDEDDETVGFGVTYQNCKSYNYYEVA